MIHINQQFNLPAGWTAEITGFYNGRLAEGQATVHSLWSISAGLRKKICGDKAGIYLYLNDLFLTNKPRFDINSSLQQGWYKERRDTRMLGISVTYRLNTGNAVKKSNGETRIEESKRINL